MAELHAYVPPGTPFFACTATITRSIRKEIVTNLEVDGCLEVSISPDRPNIFYDVKPRNEIDVDFSNILNMLCKHNKKALRVIVYCRNLDICSDLYAHFKFELGSEGYFPPDSTQCSDNRLFGMFHALTPEYNKEVILKSLADPEGIVRVVFATVALGMGVNMKKVDNVIHYGAPRSLEDYFQESGRGGRNGDNAVSVVYWKKN